MDEIALVFDPLPSPDLVRLVEENVITHTILVTGMLEWSPVNYFLKSAHGDWVGAASAFCGVVICMCVFFG